MYSKLAMWQCQMSRLTDSKSTHGPPSIRRGNYSIQAGRRWKWTIARRKTCMHAARRIQRYYTIHQQRVQVSSTAHQYLVCLIATRQRQSRERASRIKLAGQSFESVYCEHVYGLCIADGVGVVVGSMHLCMYVYLTLGPPSLNMGLAKCG